MFIHLHTHSYYSFLEGLPSPQALAQQAARLGMPALALTDHHNLTGAIEFYQACLELGVQPILGLELAVQAPQELGVNLSGNLVLLAMDLRGWASLCRLSSAVQNEPGASLSFSRLSQDTDGLICLTGGGRSLLDQFIRFGQSKLALAYLDSLASHFPERLYVELQPGLAQDDKHLTRLTLLAQRNKIPTLVCAEVYYLDQGEEHLQRLLTAMRLNCRLEQVPDSACAPPDAYFTTAEQMAARCEHLPRALETSGEIAARCQLELPLGKANYPALDLPPETTPSQILRQKAEAGAQALYGDISIELQDRLDHELAVISSYGYDSLFLIMEEIIAFARSSGVPVSSRGSAASSLVAHCLGITTPDPLRLNLYFERFLNPARATPPDIDTDLCSRRRDEVIRFVYKRFGQQRVAMVGTINRFRRRSALREVAKAYGLPAAEIKKLSESLPHRWWGPRPASDDPERPFAILEKQYPDPRYQPIFRDAARLLGLPRHLSVHAGGVVIAPGPITDLVPTQMAPKGVVITQLDLESVEKLGLVKIDLLGIRGLTVLGDVAARILEQQASSISEHPPHKSHPGKSPLLDVLENIPEDDSATAELVRSAGTIGCFQIESPGMRATLREIQAASVDDIMVALALYRPGPLSGGLKDAFVRRHLGQESVEQLHPALTSLLSDTYGVILYQEQVLRIAHELAGLSLADADLLRRAMSHFDPGERMKTLKEKFIHGVWEHNQVPESTAERIWELMAAFAGYGFPKAHAASYAQIGWRAAWCKAHYPAVFMAAVLANWGGYYRQGVYLTEVRRRGMKLRPPHVNFARREFSVRYLEGEPVLFMGLDQVKELTRRTQLRILRERPFKSLEDFLVRVDPRPVEAENLVRVGALAGMGTIPALLSALQPGGWRGGQLFLFPFEEISGDGSASGDWPLAQRVYAQEAILGTGVDAHRLELFADQIKAAHALNTLDAASKVGQQVRVAGMRQTWRRSRTAGGEAIYFMSFEDLDGMLDVVILSDVYRRSRSALKEAGPYLVDGLVEVDRTSGEPFIRANRIWLLR